MFRSLTVRENLMVAAQPARKDGSRRAGWTMDRVFGLFPRLKERHAQIAGSLSGGEQQMLAIGRALMGNPRVLLMDEPSEGLAPQIVAEVGRIIAQLKAEGPVDRAGRAEHQARARPRRRHRDHQHRRAWCSTARPRRSSLTTRVVLRSILACSEFQARTGTITGTWPTCGTSTNRPRRASAASRAQSRPKSITVDMHAHVAIPRAGEIAGPHLDPSKVPLDHFSTPETKAHHGQAGRRHRRPHPQHRRAVSRDGRHGRRRAAHLARAAAALLHGPDSTSRCRPRRRSTTASPNMSASTPTGCARSAACRCPTATRP